MMQVHGRLRHVQRGQSLVEVCVACIALVPLAIGLTYVGQYVHIRHTVQQAAREAAWDAAVSPSVYDASATPGLAAEQARLHTRHFANADTPIDPGAGDPPAFGDTMLLDYSGQQLLTPHAVTLAEYSSKPSPGVEGVIETALSGATSLLADLPFVNGGVFPPDANGYVTARVEAKTIKAAHFKPFDTLDLTFHSQTVLLADAWNADGAGESDSPGRSDAGAYGAPIPGRTVVKSLPPSAAFLNGGFASGLTSTLDFVGGLPIIKVFFPINGLNPGRAAPDVIPYDKLQPYER